MKFTRRELLESVAVAAILIGIGHRSEAWPVHGSGTIAPPSTVPFVNEVTTSAPDIIRVEIRDPLIQRGTCQFLGSSFPGGTDQSWTTSTNPNPAPQSHNCIPVGYPSNLLTLRFDDIIPTNWYNRNAGDVAADWLVTGLTVSRVYRKSYPYCEGAPHFLNGNTSASQFAQTASRHYVWLKLSGPLSSGTAYTITPPAGTGLSAFTLNFNDSSTRAHTLLVNQAGHRASDDLKLGYLSAYIPGSPNEGQINFASDYSISTFDIIDKNGSTVFTGSVAERSTPTTVEAGDGNSGFLRIYESATQQPASILGLTFANPGVFTTDIPMSNGQIVKLQGLGKGLSVTGAVWSSANGGQIVYTVTNNQGGGAYVAGQVATFTAFSPSGFNGVFPVFAATGTTVTVLAPDPGSVSVLGVMSNPATTQIAPLSGNTSNYYVVANATASPNTCTLKQMALPSGASGSDVSTVGLGPWGPGTFLTPTTAAALGADTNGGYGFDSLMLPCYSANRAATHVYGLDYSSATADLPSSGSPYRIKIAGLGVSDPITITEGSWYNVAWNWMKGLYHQTSGKAIDNRFGYYRPDALINGANGCVLYKGLLPMGFTNESGGYAGVSNLSESMIALSPFITATQSPAMIGGAYHDSGDWPSLLAGHGPVFFTLLNMGYEFCGGTTGSIAAAATTTFNFPRASETWGSSYSSIDGMADAVHAAIYFAEYYRQNQDAFGAVPSGNSFGSTGGFGDGAANELIPSSATSYPFALAAPDHTANYVFAALAAKIAIQLYNYLGSITTLVQQWIDASVNAFAWSEGVTTGLQSDSNFYYNTTTYNGTALGICANTVTGNGLHGSLCPIWTTTTLSTALGPPNGGITQTTTLVGGSGGTPGTYTGVSLTGGSGAGAKATIVVGVGGNVTSVSITTAGIAYVYGDILSASSGDIGGTTGFSFKVYNTVPPNGTLNYYATVWRSNAAATIFRLKGILGQTQTPYDSIFMSPGVGMSDASFFQGLWEAYNAPNNTALLNFMSLIGYPASWGTGLGNDNTASANSTNAYYTSKGSIGTLPSLKNFYGYMYLAKTSGINHATCIGARKFLAAQLALTLGANPSGLCFNSGIGQRNTLGILHRDWQATTRLVGSFQPPPAGLTPFGWAGTTNPFGQNNFSNDNPVNWTVVNPTGLYESTNGSKRIVKPNNQCLPMWEGTIENSYCIQIMEFAGPNQIVSNFIAAMTLWCWDGNTSKT